MAGLGGGEASGEAAGRMDTAQPYIDESEGFGDVAWRLTDNRILQMI